MEMIICVKYSGRLELAVAAQYNNGDVVCLECGNNKICTIEKEDQNVKS